MVISLSLIELSKVFITTDLADLADLFNSIDDEFNGLWLLGEAPCGQNTQVSSATLIR